MKKVSLILILAALVFSAVMPVFADNETIILANPGAVMQNAAEENNGSAEGGSELFSSVQVSEETAGTESGTEKLLWSNLNEEPVKNHPAHYSRIPIKEGVSPILLTRVRTYHWNNGSGAVPGTISVYDDDSKEKICEGKAIGRSAYGTANVYWEALVECMLYPGHNYRVKVSDPDSWSHNEGSRGSGMFELYGIWPAPEGYVPAPQAPVSAAPAQAPQTNAPQTVVFQESALPLPTSAYVGEIIRMGRYEQDNYTGNGREPIEWLVLSVSGDRALVISRNVIDVKSFPEMTNNFTWETSSFRQWLNQDLYNSAFTAAEKERILPVTNKNPNNPQYGTPGGNDTQDRIFLLSINEAEQYLKSDYERKCAATEYAKAAGGYFEEVTGSTASWFLRSPGAGQKMSAYVDKNGSVNYSGPLCGVSCESVYYGIRPAFWLKLPQTGFRVTYKGNHCLTKVPTDNNLYQPGQKVTVLFSPVEYVPGWIFSGWDGNGDGGADYGYYYNTFVMPNRNVELNATCYIPYYDQPNDTPPDRGGQQYHYPDDNISITDPGRVPNTLYPDWSYSVYGDGVG